MIVPDHCVDCGKELPLDKPIYRASDMRGARCERCDALAAAGEAEVARMRDLAKAPPRHRQEKSR
jgi:hypothetical protein